MRVHFDPEADALYLRLDDSAIVESEEVHPGVILDFNANDEVVGVEILRVAQRVPGADLTSFSSRSPDPTVTSSQAPSRQFP